MNIQYQQKICDFIGFPPCHCHIVPPGNDMGEYIIGRLSFTYGSFWWTCCLLLNITGIDDKSGDSILSV